MPHVESADGSKIFYRSEGRGPTLILSTASFSTHLHWRDAQSALAKRLRVVTWDYRGHGRSEAPEDPERYSLSRVLQDLDAVRRAVCGDEATILGGLSVGGLFSLSYALAHPERVRALLLFNTGPGFKRPEAAQAWGEMLERAASKMERVGLEAYLEGKRAQAELVGLRPESDAAREAVRGVLSSSVGGLTRFARRIAGPVPNLVDELGRIRQPTLVLAGEKDEAFQRASHVMEAKIPDAERVELADAGHVVNLDQPEAFVREVEGFLERRGLV